ncbi:MAG TPA: hypothetical protein VFT74_01165, partial [Isosphaeraceae bacterium]|nr:hypothetical protein [Isosphaeraceae bacterium]
PGSSGSSSGRGCFDRKIISTIHVVIDDEAMIAPFKANRQPITPQNHDNKRKYPARPVNDPPGPSQIGVKPTRSKPGFIQEYHKPVLSQRIFPISYKLPKLSHGAAADLAVEWANEPGSADREHVRHSRWL